MSKAKRRKKGLAKHARHVAAQKRRARVRRAKKKLKKKQEPLLDLFPDTEGLTDAEAAKVWEEFFYWEDYYERNPGSAWGAPV